MKTVFFFIILLISTGCFSQKQKKVSAFADFHVNSTQYDRTRSNNAGGFGGGLQVFMNTESKFRPNIEVASDIFGGTKQLFMTIDGKPIYSKDEVTGIFAGTSYAVSERCYLDIAAGPSFFNSKTYLAVKPAVGIYFPSNKRLVAKISLTHIFQRDDISNQSFGFLSFGLGIRLF